LNDTRLASHSPLDALPDDLVDDRVRQKLNHLYVELDQLLFLDETHELAADRDTLIRIASNPDLVPESHRDIVVLETSKFLGRRLKSFKKTSHRIRWSQGAQYGLPIAPPSDSMLQGLGIVKTASLDELGDAVRRAMPELPDMWTSSDDPARLEQTVSDAFLANRTVWDCLVANLGFWAALVVLGSLIVLTSLLEIGWQFALAFAIAYSGVATAYIMLSCVTNQSFSAF